MAVDGRTIAGCLRVDLRTIAGCLHVLLLCGGCLSFNLDPDSVLTKTGEPGSLFGFSLAMHRMLLPEDKTLLLVGSPKAKALSGQTAEVTGGLYSCDFSSPSQSCDRVSFDDEENVATESKEDQWMGVTVSSQGPGGKIVTCAHRYQTRRNVGRVGLEVRHIIGRCYVLSQSLGIDTDTEDEGGNWHFCRNRGQGHERFGSCQQGLSAAFTKDYHYVLFGAPGAYNWKGVVRAEQKNETLLEMGIYSDGPFEAGDENIRDADLVPVPANSYLGFSLDSGKSLVKKGQLTIVAGAPRANHSGAVVLLKKGQSKDLLAEFILEGEGLASSFGYDVAVLDLNGDTWQDIVVGAPQYFEKEGVIGGAVYVYVNRAGRWNKATPLRIDGPQDSMFGLSVENLGDINQDGYHDFAVGAPYDAAGQGKVYIYHGAAEGIRMEQLKKAAQVLSAQPNTQMFGYSLSGNMDLDSNSYPDLAVGSLSDSVFVYRARPVVSVHKEVRTKPEQLDLSKKNCGDTVCLEVEACFSYTANPKSYNPRLTLAYSFSAEAERRDNNLPSRVVFTKRSSSDQDYESTGTLTLSTQGKRQCVTQKLTLQDNIRDKLRGVPIDVSVEIRNAARSKRQSSLPELQPVLDANQPMTARAEVSFMKEGCGSDNKCQSNLQVKYRFCDRTVNDQFTPLTLEDGVPSFSLTNQKTVALEVTVTNQNGDDAHEAYVIANFPPSVSYAAFRPAPNEEKPVSCTANPNGSQAECELGNPFKRDAKTTFYLILGTTNINPNTTELEISLQRQTTSEQKDLAVIKARAKVLIELQLSVTGHAHPPQVYFAGKVKGQSAMKTESDIGSLIRYQFRIINLGTTKNYGTASLVVQWPKETLEEKWLLYLLKITASGDLTSVTCSPQSEVNTLEVTQEADNSRRRRALEDSRTQREPSYSLLSDKRKSQTLSCDSGARCVELRCPLQDLDSDAVVTLHARLWNGTFLEDFSELHYLDVLVKASIIVEGKAKNMVLKNAETQVRVTVFPERRTAASRGLPWWIILVAILLGLLLLGLLVFLLWKCGFFQRVQYVPSYNAVRIKREQRNQQDWDYQEKTWMDTRWQQHKDLHS